MARKPKDEPADSGTGSDSASTGDPLELEGAAFVPPDEPTIPPADTDLDYEPPPPELIEWTPERAGAVVRAGGFLLHTADPLGNDPGGEGLWKATEQDALEIGAPLARILNRYAPARRLAGLSDEGELAFALVGYTKRNLAYRGQLVAARREEEQGAHADGTMLFHDEQPPPPEPPV